KAQAAMAMESKASPQPTFGVVWFSARTEVDKENRVVILEEVTLTKANFPTAADRQDDYLALVKKNLADLLHTMSLPRLEASLAVTQAEAAAPKVEIKNEPPRILFSTRPAVLVLVDGKPVLRQVPGTNLLRVINTRAFLLLNQD